VIANKNARDYWVSNAKEALEKLEARLNVGTKSTHSRKRRKT
jgi:porphobilinogen deaminase